MDENKILHHLTSCERYEFALLTTFNFDIGFFERYVVNAMYDKGLRKIALFVDAKELTKSLQDVDNCAIGRKYFVSPIEMNGAFHPKLALLLGQDCAKLIVASANLTVNGYFRNNEIFNVFEYDAKHPENLKLITDAIHFFSDINKLAFQQDEELFAGISKLFYYGHTCKNEEVYLLHNLSRPILEQTSELLREVRAIDIAVPFYDNDLSAAQTIGALNPGAQITLYVQNRKSCFPTSRQNSPFITELRVYDSPREGSTAFYHGKVIRFDSKDHSYILYGSANCTQSALTKSFSDGGNIECVILEKGGPGEFDSFYSSFDFSIKSLQCDPISYSTVRTPEIVFRYGMIGKTVQLVFGTRVKRNYAAFLGETKLQASIYDGTIVISADPVIFEEVPNVFDISFQSGDYQETVRCWYLDQTSLLVNRTREIRDIVQEIDFDSNEDRYLQDKKLIIREIPISPDELKDEISLRQSVKPATTESDEEDEDDGIVSFVIPPADTVQRLQRIDRLHEICHRYISLYHSSFTSNRAASSHHKTTSTPGESTARQASNDEIVFRKFVERRIRDLTSSPFSGGVTYNRYLSYCLVFESIFKKYTIDEPKKVEEKDLFPIEFVADAEAKMCQRLLEKVITEAPTLDTQELEDTIVLTIHAILSLWLCSDGLQNRHGMRCRMLLQNLDVAFNIRPQQRFMRYTLEAADKNNLRPSCKIDYGRAITYLDGLFGYKDQEGLQTVIRNDYGEQAIIMIDVPKKDVYVRTTVQDIGQHMVIRHTSLKELVGFCRRWGIPRFQIVVESGKDKAAVKSMKAARFVVYDVICEQRSITQTTRSYAGDETKRRMKY